MKPPKPFVLVGGECTGKSSLAAALAEKYQAPLSGEYAAQFALDLYPQMIEYEHVAMIMEGQLKALEEAQDKALLAEMPFWIADTDLVSTLVYSQSLYGRYPEEMPAAMGRMAGHRYFLLSPQGVPWQPHPTRSQAQERGLIYAAFERALAEWQLPYQVVDAPSYEDRLEQVAQAIDLEREFLEA